MSEAPPLWVVETNSDTTEGRGRSIIHSCCTTESTALRVAVGKGVQGSPAYVFKVEPVMIKGKAYYPAGSFPVQEATPEDIENDARRKALREALAKAKELGLSEDEIKAMQWRGSR